MIKNKEEIERIGKSGKILAEVLKILKKEAKIGVSLLQLDALAKKSIESLGGIPAFLNYFPYGAKKPYPNTLCASLNEVIVHGVPTERKLRDGDVLKLDLGVVFDGFYSDSAITVIIGNPSKEALNLIKATELALVEGIKSAKSGNTLGDVGFAIQSVASKYGVSVVRGLGGHGVGRDLHEEPFIDNMGSPGKGLKLKDGMVVALEPMFSLGSGEIKILPDDSYATKDGSLSAQFEHTVLITKAGGEILTK